MEQGFIEKITKKVMTILEADFIPVEASARHVHLSKKDAVELFGEKVFTIKKNLSQPGQFQCQERVKLIGPKGIISGVAILGPFRERTQVEITKTDAIALGINPPVRDSGNLAGSESVFIMGEKGMVSARECVIVAKRHIHMSIEDGKHFQVQDGDLVKVKLFSQRPIILEEVLVRIKESYKLAMHIDFDEANAAGLDASTFCKII